ncbi:MAG: class II glutamine amidotransferase [Chitinophagaceae bacterium]|nr:class II glutamine amidotransferase [Chitinophagaceae bacterium]
MCRWLAYYGAPILMSDLLVTPEHNLIQQSLKANAPRTPTNGDGFGLGWYSKQPHPGLFRSIRPAWNDTNLQDLAGHIESPLFMAHVRATSLATIQETNCHPFRYKNWLFMHNGQIEGFQHMKRELLLKIDPKYFNNISGTTDSEIMFHLALTFGLENDVNDAISLMVQEVETTARKHGIAQCLWMTLAISDGNNLWAFRYGSNGKGPTLYISPDIDELVKLNPELKGHFGDFAVCIVSEPIGKHTELWRQIPEQSKVLVEDSSLLVSKFEI